MCHVTKYCNTIGPHWTVWRDTAVYTVHQTLPSIAEVGLACETNLVQGCHKQSADVQAQFMSVVKLPKFIVFVLAFSFSFNWDLPLDVYFAERKSYACTTYVHTLPDFTTAIQSRNKTTQKLNA